MRAIKELVEQIELKLSVDEVYRPGRAQILRRPKLTQETFKWVQGQPVAALIFCLACSKKLTVR
jgi:hypothetical protein